MPVDANLVMLILALPFVAIFFRFYFRLHTPIWTALWRSSSPARPQPPDKRHRPGRLARWRAGLGVRHRWSRWTVGFSNGLLSTSVKLDDLRHHTLVCGATGSGKTSALLLLIDAFADKLPIIVVDCKASAVMRDHLAALPNAAIWTIGGSLSWDPLRGDATSVANRLIQGEWYSREADVYRAAAERYLLWLLHVLDLAELPRTPQRILEYLEPTRLMGLLRSTPPSPETTRLATSIQGLGPFEREGIAGFRARFGLVIEGIASPGLGPGLVLDDAIRARRPVLFSLDAATYPALATKIGAWVLLDLVRLAAQRPGPCLVIVDEFSALGREGRHIVPLLARTREAGMACVVATQGLADLARVDPNLPQQVTQNTRVRLALRQGSAEDQEGWSALLGGAPVPFAHSDFIDRDRARAVAPDDLAMLRTGEAVLQILPGASDGTRKRLWIGRPRKVGPSRTAQQPPEPDRPITTAAPWAWPTHTEWRVPDAHTIESAPSSTLAADGAGPGDPGRGAALATAHESADRSLVLRQPTHSDEPDQRPADARLPEDDRPPVACTCACHSHAEGRSGSLRPPAPSPQQPTRPTAARSDGGGSGSLAAGAGPTSGLDHGTGAAARPARPSTRPGRPAAARPQPPTRRRAGPSHRPAGSDRSRAEPEAGPD